MTPTTPLHELVANYQKSRELLVAYRFQHFRSGQFVRMNSDRFHGVGMVAYISSDVPPDHIAVRLENGNTWWYPMMDVAEIITDLKQVPHSARWIKLRWSGYQQMRGPRHGAKLP